MIAVAIVVVVIAIWAWAHLHGTARREVEFRKAFSKKRQDDDMKGGAL